MNAEVILVYAPVLCFQENFDDEFFESCVPIELHLKICLFIDMACDR